ncbi:MAG: TIGR02569 family protein [Caulobacteraceae bacterium]
MEQAPPNEVIAAFGLSGTPQRLAGGQGETWRVGDAVLKRADDTDEAAWVADVLETVRDTGFRVPRPFRTRAGDWIVGGWTAQTFVAGAHARDRWSETLMACDAFHRALAHLPEPAFVRRRTDPWAVADRLAWSDGPIDVDPRLAPLLVPLTPLRGQVSAPSQAIHGDFTENVLFADPLAPAVIDFSPYWRPAAFAKAVVVVDALTWRNAEADLVDALAVDPEGAQMLLRALLRRLIEIDRHWRQRGRDGFSQLPAYERTAALVRSAVSGVAP